MLQGKSQHHPARLSEGVAPGRSRVNGWEGGRSGRVGKVHNGHGETSELLAHRLDGGTQSVGEFRSILGNSPNQSRRKQEPLIALPSNEVRCSIIGSCHGFAGKHGMFSAVQVARPVCLDGRPRVQRVVAAAPQHYAGPQRARLSATGSCGTGDPPACPLHAPRAWC